MLQELPSSTRGVRIRKIRVGLTKSSRYPRLIREGESLFCQRQLCRRFIIEINRVKDVVHAQARDVSSRTLCKLIRQRERGKKPQVRENFARAADAAGRARETSQLSAAECSGGIGNSAKQQGEKKSHTQKEKERERETKEMWFRDKRDLQCFHARAVAHWTARTTLAYRAARDCARTCAIAMQCNAAAAAACVIGVFVCICTAFTHIY
ncbi:unnamed protein product [Trichogramma brassicae]|uniref:Transmembrane protein n=1 Tax=Trichogramma brassicae TaxID=86971 RepID=A0A6H5IQ41_9HYME|nr:unnamed protein product [Trichogramma brassicae]